MGTQIERWYDPTFGILSVHTVIIKPERKADWSELKILPVVDQCGINIQRTEIFLDLESRSASLHWCSHPKVRIVSNVGK